MGGRISETSLVVASQKVMSSSLGDGAALLNLETGTYYGLNAVGSEVWRQIAEQTRVADIRDRIVELYDIDSDRCSRDLLALIGALAEVHLVEVADASDPEVSGSRPL